jgi:nucleoid DNA-binding protein
MSAIKDDLITSVQAALLAAGVTMNKKESEVVTDAVIDGLLNVTKEKGQVRTRIGTFRWANVEARDRINPRNKETVHVEAYSTLKFKVGKAVRVSAADAKAAAKKPAAKAAAPKAAPAKAAPAAKAVAAKPVAKPMAKKPVVAKK